MTGGTRRGIVVSTLAEARFFADGGFDDILYAYPLPFDKVEECATLAERLEAFHVLVDSPDALALLKRRPLGHSKRWKVWLKIDCENGRGDVYIRCIFEHKIMHLIASWEKDLQHLLFMMVFKTFLQNTVFFRV